MHIRELIAGHLGAKSPSLVRSGGSRTSSSDSLSIDIAHAIGAARRTHHYAIEILCYVDWDEFSARPPNHERVHGLVAGMACDCLGRDPKWKHKEVIKAKDFMRLADAVLVELRKPSPCDECGGTGKVVKDVKVGPETCKDCIGLGLVSAGITKRAKRLKICRRDYPKWEAPYMCLLSTLRGLVQDGVDAVARQLGREV